MGTTSGIVVTSVMEPLLGLGSIPGPDRTQLVAFPVEGSTPRPDRVQLIALPVEDSTPRSNPKRSGASEIVGSNLRSTRLLVASSIGDSHRSVVSSNPGRTKRIKA